MKSQGFPTNPSLTGDQLSGFGFKPFEGPERWGPLRRPLEFHVCMM
jgi:hypothetical protein